MNIVEIEKVTKTFNKFTAVDSLSLFVPEGSIYGFIGPNGSGKTTTLRMIMNIFYPDNGSINVFGERLNGASTDRIGYLPEERGLYKNMKVREILKFYGSLKNGKNLKKEINRWLDALDLSDWANKKISTLSKGMSQKVQFIASIISKPELIILDEPFTGLDPVNTDTIIEEILELQSQGTTILFSTHDMSIAEKMCDFIFMIFKGKKVLDGTLTSIQDKYGSDTLRVRCNDGISALQNLEGVEKITDFGQIQELRMNGDCDPQNVLSQIMSRTSIISFELAKPSLHDIFVRIASPDKEEINNA
ncbi:MAG: ATP-binding cassette domain-containing protein [Candidatus Hatepunaea meridiana]|nr:ATP-binding cassette domain-containing protein [Candidatus Hatepunaea meridiana]